MKEISIVEPVFFTQFKCSGGACRDHCCKGWNIDLDKPTVNRYLKTRDATIRAIAAENIITTKKSYKKWGLINVSDNKSCAFMDENRLCSIHSSMGAAALSPTCAIYPRAENIFKYHIQKSLTLSCPEAVRQLLSGPEAMLFNESKIVKPHGYNTDSLDQGAQLINLMCSTIINSSGTEVEEGLYGIALLFLYLEKLDDDAEKYEKLEAYYYDIIASLQRGDIKNSINEIEPDHQLQWSLLVRLQGYLGARPTSRGWGALNHYAHRLAYIQSEGLKQNDMLQPMQRLRCAWHEKVMPWLSAHPHIMSNYLKYRIYTDGFPADHTITPLANLYLLVAEWFLIKSLMAASADLTGKIDENDMINILYSFHAVTKHDQISTAAFLQEIEHTKVNDDLSLVYLLK